MAAKRAAAETTLLELAVEMVEEEKYAPPGSALQSVGESLLLAVVEVVLVGATEEAVGMVVVVLSPHCRKPCDIPRTSVMPCYMCSTELPWYLFASLPALPFIPRPSAVQEPCYAWPRLVAALA